MASFIGHFSKCFHNSSFNTYNNNMRWVLLYSPVYSKENEVPRNKICWKTPTRVRIEIWSQEIWFQNPCSNHCVISINFFFGKEIWKKFNILVRKRWLSRKWYHVVLISFCYSPDPSKIKYEDNYIIKGQVLNRSELGSWEYKLFRQWKETL